MRILTAPEIKHIQLEILDDVHSFCVNNEIRYSLCGGSVIGAVRHKGYIPWDDDIDLMMPRTDYERFKALYRSDKNEVIDLSTMDSCEEQFMKVSRKGTVMEDIVARRRLWGVNVDIFPVDGMPADYASYTAYLQSIHRDVVENCKLYKAATKNKAYWYARYFLKRLVHGCRVDVMACKARLNQSVLAQLPENSPLSTVIFGDFRIFPFKTELFYDIGDIVFEGKQYKCINNTDTYLRTVYGDYMQLPPKEKRVSHHLYDSFI